MSVRRAQQEISSAEFAEWLAYNQIEPIGEERADLRAAIIASTIANVHRPKNRKPFKPDDFMPRFVRKAQQTWQQMKQTVMAALTAKNHQKEIRRRG